MTIPLGKPLCLLFLLSSSYCLEDKQHCEDGECNKDVSTNHYTRKTNDMDSQERDTLSNDDGKTVTDEPLVSSDNEVYEFPPVKRLLPGSVGDVVELHIEPGMVHKRITRAVEPPLFEIPNFLSFEECNIIIKAAKTNNITTSEVFGANQNVTGKNSSEITRISKQTWVEEKNVGAEFWKELLERLSKLTEIPMGVIQRSEYLQVVNYGTGGHYHAHVDSNKESNVPCCFHTSCQDVEHTDEWISCCRLCRFMTVMYYLNDVIQGGETAFPLADMPEDLLMEKMDDPPQTWSNLSHYCHNSSVVVTPKKGTAIVWYSHFLDDKGYLGNSDDRSNHGGCDIIRGEKWIATNWISITTYENRFKTSFYFDRK